MSDLENYLENNLNAGLHLIPPHMHEGIKNYVLRRIRTGNFLYAVLSNNFQESFARADYENQRAMFGWAQFIHNHVPSACHGSPEAVEAWLAKDNS